MEQNPLPDVDPLSPDAPIHHLLSIKENPLVVKMSDQELTELIKRLRTIATSPQTMTSALQSESKRRRPLSAAAQKRKDIIDNL